MKAFKKIRDKIAWQRIKRGDSEAFGEIYDEYNDKIFRYLYFKVPNKQVAEDLTANVFLKSWEYITRQGVKEVDNFQAFFYRVAHNLLIDYYRQRKQDAPLDSLDKLVQNLHKDEIVKIDQRYNIAELMKVISQLSDDHSDVITLRYVEDYSISEIANILGKTENNVRVTLHRAIKCLKKDIDLNLLKD